MSRAARCSTFQLSSIAAGRRRGGLQSPGGQHGDHHGVGVAEPLQQFGFGGAQRRAVHGQRPPAGVLDRPAQRLDVRGVAGQVLCAVVEHRDRRAGLRRRPAAPARPRSGSPPAERTRSRSSARCRTGRRAAGAGCRRRRGPGRCGPARRCRPRRVDRPINSASAACSPLTSTVGTPLAITVSMPLCQAR